MVKFVMFLLLGAIGIVLISIGPINVSKPYKKTNINQIATTTPNQKESNNNYVVEPIAGFKERITKKLFGSYITPDNSPIKPERFFGYHTGVDVEYIDTATDVHVYSIANGTIVLSRTATGYGGVMVIQYEINKQTLYGVYGHLRASSMKELGKKVFKGEQIADLGTGYSKETDGERKHLHFGLSNINTIKGYATNIEELNRSWIDPLTFYKNQEAIAF